MAAPILQDIINEAWALDMVGFQTEIAAQQELIQGQDLEIEGLKADIVLLNDGLDERDAEILSLKTRIADLEGGQQEPPPPPPPPPASAIPLSFDDPIFANAVASPGMCLGSGGTVIDKKITGLCGEASIRTEGNLTATRVAIDSAEGIRIINNNTWLLDRCYIRATGSGDAHADGIQGYGGGGPNSLLRAVNSAIGAYGSATAGVFAANDWSGSFEFENTLFHGSTYGVRLHADNDSVISLSLKDCYFLEGVGIYLLEWRGGTINIRQWENVRRASIVNGELVPGDLIAQPPVNVEN